MKNKITELLNESIEVKKKVVESLTDDIERAVSKVVECYKNNGKLILFGNGGSAADSQHIAGEMIHQFELEGRKALPAIALTTDSSVMTAIGNDWGFDKVFERQVEGLAKKEDVIIGFSTSGNSGDVVKGVEQAKKNGAFTIVFSGRDGGKLKEVADLSIVIPSESTARIQESHITVGHILCKLVEEELAEE
ncbi:MAG: D-sedoheptulose 7-phosphate isomerase [Candidatus Woesearchaeota archaeon]|jgi:D-sedoheptulose 7-phosphate isomerase|nr:D-sedoheptulose 7-phosphate isomerase [Candidatus Woesearchaeota archaeon]MDP7505835.1 D-sedoheptulose 7-phosphate isomerase [Candidatus Woesearchaeota archaeon]MDP7610719.1 D-sedoheptulose 7-phosphate isomerase [Candidatus Woesearchaeota archaeon]|tara:strand:+ start:3241 stop:3816 length:576 start_codon:yes stop_codon:yes gene_type:complete